MPIHIEEREAGRILYIAFTDVWDTTDLEQAVTTIQTYLFSANHPVYLVVDASSTYQVPLGTLSHIPMTRPSMAKALITECVFIGGTSVTRSIAQAAFRLCHLNRVSFVETDEQAWSHLQSIARGGIPV